MKNTNEVRLNDVQLVNLRADTVSEEYVAYGITFHKADGSVAYGKAQAPSGVLDITENGVYPVLKYATANVQVVAKGTLEISENGTYDVTDIASVIVNVESGGTIIDYYDSSDFLADAGGVE